MAKISKIIKSDGIENSLEKFCKEKFNSSRKDDKCIRCGSEKIEISDFTDIVSVKEYRISGLCQECQDEVFNEDEE